MRIKKNITRELLVDPIPNSPYIRIVWEAARRITNKILEVKGLKEEQGWEKCNGWRQNKQSKGVESKQMHMEMVLQTFLRSHALIRETTEMNSF